MLAANNLKKCSSCRVTHPTTHFSRDKNRLDGRYARCKGCVKNYNLANRDRIVAKQRIYNETHVEQIQKSHKDYAAKRFFYIRSRNLRIKHGKVECASEFEIASLWRKQRGKCMVTGRRLTRLNAQLDHIIPFINGGSANIDNLRWVHRDVNYAKRDLSETDFLQLCREVVAMSNILKGG